MRRRGAFVRAALAGSALAWASTVGPAEAGVRALRSALDATAGVRSPSSQTEPKEPAKSADSALVARERELETWRELLELDLAPELVRVAEPRIAPDAPRARDGEALALVARARLAVGSTNAAKELLDRPVDDAAGREALLCARARLLLDEDELGAARTLLALAADARLDDVRPERLLLLGRALVRSGQSRAAEPFLAAFARRAPRDAETPSALHMLAQIALEARDLPRAAALREDARKLAEWQAFYRARRVQVREHPDEPLPRLGLVELWLAVGEHERARGAANELCALFPAFARGFAARAECERALGLAADARASVARALELRSDLPDALLVRARLARAAGDLAAARADLERVLAADERDDGRTRAAELELARLLLAQGDRAGADAHHARYRALGGVETLEPRR